MNSETTPKFRFSKLFEIFGLNLVSFPNSEVSLQNPLSSFGIPFSLARRRIFARAPLPCICLPPHNATASHLDSSSSSTPSTPCLHHTKTWPPHPSTLPLFSPFPPPFTYSRPTHCPHAARSLPHSWTHCLSRL